MFYISRIGGTEFLYNNGKVQLNKKPVQKEKVGTSILVSELQIHTFKTSLKSSDDEIQTLAEIKIFEEYGLDPQNEYKITFVKKEIKFDKTYLVEVFFVESDKLRIKLEDIKNRYKNIDFLAIPFLSFSTLYSKNKLTSLGNDVFIYCGLKEAYLAIYREGKYLAHKSLSSFEDLAIKINTSSGQNIGASHVRSLFLTKGFEKNNYEENEQELYTFLLNSMIDMFEKVNSILLYNRNIFGLDNIDNIFIEYGSKISGQDDFLDSINFEYTIKELPFFIQDDGVTTLNSILSEYIHEQIDTKNNAYNFTVYKRIPPFYKQPLNILLAGSLLSFAIYYMYGIYEDEEVEILEEKISILKSRNSNKILQYKRLQKESKKIEHEIEIKNNALKRLNKSNKRFNDSIKEYELLTKKSQKAFLILQHITNALETHKLAIENFEMKDNEITLNIFTLNKKRDFLAIFIKELIGQGYKETTIETINKEDFSYQTDDNQTITIKDIYKGEVKIIL